MDASLEDSILPVENYDPIGRFFRESLHLTPWGFGILVLVANVIVDAWLGWRFNIFITAKDSAYPGLLQDLTALVVDFVSMPVIAGIYLWTPIGATKLFRQLLQARVFKSEEIVVETVNESRPLFKNRYIFYGFLALSLLYMLSQLGAYLGWVPWKSAGGYLDSNPAMSYFRGPFWFLNLYTLAFGAYNVAITVMTLRKMFRTKEIKILPLHPDRCGGLISISQYSMRVAWAIASAGLVISAAAVYEISHRSLGAAYPIILGIIVYLIFAPVFFFWPLGTAHNAMQEAKDAELLKFAHRFDSVYEQLKSNLENKEQDFEADLKKLENLKKLYGIASEFPVWPFDISNLRRFFTVVTAPLVPVLISILIDLATSLLPFGG